MAATGVLFVIFASGTGSQGSCEAAAVQSHLPYGCSRLVPSDAKGVAGCCKACDSTSWCRHWWRLGDGRCALFANCVGISKVPGEAGKEHFTGTRKRTGSSSPKCNSNPNTTEPLWMQFPTAKPSVVIKSNLGPLPADCKRLDRSVVITPRKDPPCKGWCLPPECGCLPPKGAMAPNKKTGWWGFASSSREDEALYYRYFCGMCEGTYVEMGALDGLRASNTLFFERALGWNGLLVEASPTNLPKVKLHRPRNKIVGLAACPAGGKKYIEFMSNGPVGGDIALAPPRFKDRYWKKDWRDQVVKVPCAPLHDILRSQRVTFVDLFSLDVEGSEEQVLRSFDWSIPVRVWVIEMDGHNLTKNQAVRDMLLSNGYRRAHKHWSTTRFCTPYPCANNEVFENKELVAEMN
eukprot:Hpha_TRINITY_DN2713_c0_g1::TRINITY_DN2713_c0_g1_i1::g.110454::m.110454